MKTLRNLIVAGSLALLTSLYSGKATADDFFKGLRGPTNWQLDERIGYSKNEKGVESLTNNLIFKYWDGDKQGMFGFVNIPYKFVHSSKSFDNGLGDITLGMGPRGRIENFHWVTYGALTFPSGEKNIGNDRLDAKVGATATYLMFDKRYEIDGSFEYNFTGNNAPDEINSGVLVGKKVNDKIRVGTGLTGLVKTDGSNVVNSRSILRYTFSPKLHIEVVGDLGLTSENIPKSKSISLYIRRNFSI